MKRTILKKLVLLSGGGLLPAVLPATCARNADYVTLIQSAGGAAISTTVAEAVPDADKKTNDVLITPATKFFQSLWNNWVFLQFPQDFPRQVAPVQ